jgi:hypothetical protein
MARKQTDKNQYDPADVSEANSDQSQAEVVAGQKLERMRTEDGHVFVAYFGLKPSETQRQALAQRAKGIKESVINGLIQDQKLTEDDIRKKTPRGVHAMALAVEQAEKHVAMYVAQTLPPLVVECDGRAGHSSMVTIRGGVSRIPASAWKLLESHGSSVIKSAITEGRILSPADTESLASTKDQERLENLVLRTHCPHGLVWLHGREVARGGGNASRKRILDACLAKAKRMGIAVEKAS